jgi:hypothetical protein
MRQKNQYMQLHLALAGEDRGEAPDAVCEGTEPLVAKRNSESPADEARLIADASSA